MYENTDSKSNFSSLSKTEPLNDEQMPLPVVKDSCQRCKVPTTNKNLPPLIDVSNEMNGSDKQLPTKDTGLSPPIGTNIPHIIYPIYTEFFLLLYFQLHRVLEWNSHAMPYPVMDSEIIIHRPRVENNNSTSIETVIDSDSEIKSVLIFLFILLRVFKTCTKFLFFLL